MIPPPPNFFFEFIMGLIQESAWYKSFLGKINQKKFRPRRRARPRVDGAGRRTPECPCRWPRRRAVPGKVNKMGSDRSAEPEFAGTEFGMGIPNQSGVGIPNSDSGITDSDRPRAGNSEFGMRNEIRIR